MIELFEHATEPVFEVGAEEQFTYINPRAEQRFGRDAEDLLGSVIWEEFPAARDSPLYETVRTARENGEEASFEGAVPPFEGLYEGFVAPSDDGIAVLARNMLHLPVETLRRLPTGVFRMNAEDENLVGMSDALVSMVEAESREELLDRRVKLYKDPDDREELFEQLQTEGAIENHEIPMETFQGNDIWVSVSAVKTEVPGETSHLEGIIQDITERKEQKRMLTESKQRYKSLTEDVLDTSVVGTIILDEEFQVVWANRTIGNYFGVDQEELVGNDKRESIRTDIKQIFEDPDQFEETVLATYDDNTYVENFECHVLSGEDQTERWLEHWSKPIETGLYAGGRIEHYHDITERKELLQKTERQAEEILEVSTPIVQIWDGILLATIVGTLDTERAERFTEELLTEINETESEIVLIDITGVPTIDTATAEHLADTINAVDLLGASVIMTGIRPEIAQTMTKLGISLSGVETRQSLRGGLRTALKRQEDLQEPSDRRATVETSGDDGVQGGERG